VTDKKNPLQKEELQYHMTMLYIFKNMRLLLNLQILLSFVSYGRV